ncbi:MAG: DUF4124 domain-containing protein [Thermodesulfobacteriota bacterium]
MKTIIKELLRSRPCAFVLPFSFVFFFGVLPSYANLYKWEDSKGVLHITDDLGKVPEGKRHGVEVFTIKPLHQKEAGEAPIHIPPTRPVPEKAPELYGGQTLLWWKEAFTKIREEIDTLREGRATKAQFISVFEGGRRFGQTFGDLEVSIYERYKKEIVTDNESIKDLEDKEKELRRKATINGVPREIRGE